MSLVEASLLQPLVSIAAPSLAAGLAAFLGIRLGFRKYAREKAFDARREWYEQAMRVVVAYVGNLQVITESARQNAASAVRDDHLDQLAHTVEEMNPLLSLAYLYARPKSVEAVTLLFSANSKLLAPVTVNSGVSEVRQLNIDSMEKAALFARTVGYGLAVEFRDHLGLEKLPQEVVPTLLLDEWK